MIKLNGRFKLRNSASGMTNQLVLKYIHLHVL